MSHIALLAASDLSVSDSLAGKGRRNRSETSASLEPHASEPGGPTHASTSIDHISPAAGFSVSLALPISPAASSSPSRLGDGASHLSPAAPPSRSLPSPVFPETAALGAQGAGYQGVGLPMTQGGRPPANQSAPHEVHQAPFGQGLHVDTAHYVASAFVHGVNDSSSSPGAQGTSEETQATHGSAVTPQVKTSSDAGALLAAAATARAAGNYDGAAKLEALAKHVQVGSAGSEAPSPPFANSSGSGYKGSKTPSAASLRGRSRRASSMGGALNEAQGGGQSATPLSGIPRRQSVAEGWGPVRTAHRSGSLSPPARLSHSGRTVPGSLSLTGTPDPAGLSSRGSRSSMADLARDVSDAFRRAVRHAGVTTGAGTGAVGGRSRLNPFMTAVNLLASGAPDSALVQEYAEALKRKRPRERWAQIGTDLSKGGVGAVKGGNVMSQLSSMHRVALGEARAGGVTVETSRHALRRLQRVCRLLPEERGTFEGGGNREGTLPAEAPRKGRHRRSSTTLPSGSTLSNVPRHSENTSDNTESMPETGVEFGAKGVSGGVIPYALQGDLRFYSVQYLLRRNRLRYSARVRACIRLWYRAAKTRVPGTAAGIWGVGRATYVSILTSLWPVLNPSGTPDEGLVLAELDWERDIAMVQEEGKRVAAGSTPRSSRRRRGGSAEYASAANTPRQRVVFLPEHAFNDTMFELADVWTETTAESEYCAFLLSTLRHWVAGVQGGLTALPGVHSLLNEDGASPTSRSRAPDRKTDTVLAQWLAATPPPTTLHWREVGAVLQKGEGGQADIAPVKQDVYTARVPLPDALEKLPPALPEGGDGGSNEAELGWYDSDTDDMVSSSDSGMGPTSSSDSDAPKIDDADHAVSYLPGLFAWAVRRGYALGGAGGVTRPSRTVSPQLTRQTSQENRSYSTVQEVVEMRATQEHMSGDSSPPPLLARFDPGNSLGRQVSLMPRECFEFGSAAHPSIVVELDEETRNAEHRGSPGETHSMRGGSERHVAHVRSIQNISPYQVSVDVPASLHAPSLSHSGELAAAVATGEHSPRGAARAQPPPALAAADQSEHFFRTVDDLVGRLHGTDHHSELEARVKGRWGPRHAAAGGGGKFGGVAVVAGGLKADAPLRYMLHETGDGRDPFGVPGYGSLVLPSSTGDHPGLSYGGGNTTGMGQGVWGRGTSGSRPMVRRSGRTAGLPSEGVLADALSRSLARGVWTAAAGDGRRLANRAWEGELLLAMGELEARRRERHNWQKTVAARVVGIWREMVLRSKAGRAATALQRHSKTAARRAATREKFLRVLKTLAREMKGEGSHLMTILDTVTAAAAVGDGRDGDGSPKAASHKARLKNKPSSDDRRVQFDEGIAEGGGGDAGDGAAPHEAYSAERGALIHTPGGDVFIPPVTENVKQLFADFRSEQGYGGEVALFDHLLLSGMVNGSSEEDEASPAAPRGTGASAARQGSGTSLSARSESNSTMGVPAVEDASAGGDGGGSNISECAAPPAGAVLAQPGRRSSTQHTAGAAMRNRLDQDALLLAAQHMGTAEFPRGQNMEQHGRMDFHDSLGRGSQRNFVGLERSYTFSSLTGLNSEASSPIRSVAGIGTAMRGAARAVRVLKRVLDKDMDEEGIESTDASVVPGTPPSANSVLRSLVDAAASGSTERLPGTQQDFEAYRDEIQDGANERFQRKPKLLLSDDRVLRASRVLQGRVVDGYKVATTAPHTRSHSAASYESPDLLRSNSLVAQPSMSATAMKDVTADGGGVRPVRYGVGGLGEIPRHWELLGVLPVCIRDASLRHQGLIHGVGEGRAAGAGGLPSAAAVLGEAFKGGTGVHDGAKRAIAAGGVIADGMEDIQRQLSESRGAVYVGPPSDGWVWVAWMYVDHCAGAHILPKKGVPGGASKRTSRSHGTKSDAALRVQASDSDLEGVPPSPRLAQSNSTGSTPRHNRSSSFRFPPVGSILAAPVEQGIDDADALAQRRMHMNADGSTWSKRDDDEDQSRHVILGVFGDQLTAALAFDQAVRERRARLGIPAPVRASLAARVSQLGGERHTQQHRDAKWKTNVFSPGAGVDPYDLRHLPARARHNLFTNFTLTGQLLQPPVHIRTPRVFFPASAAPPRVHRWQVYAAAVAARTAAAAATAAATVEAAARFGLEDAPGLDVLEQVRSAAARGEHHSAALAGGAEGVRAAVAARIDGAEGGGPSDGTAFRPPIQQLHVPASIPGGVGSPSPLPPSLTAREAGWVEGDNSLLRYAQVGTAKDIAGMQPEALTSFAARASRVQAAEGPLRASDLLHTPLMLALMRADRKARRRKIQAALLSMGGGVEEGGGVSSDDASAVSDSEPGGFEEFDEDLMVMLLAQGRVDMAHAYKARFSSHKTRLAEAAAAREATGQAKRIAARAAREAALERSRAEMQRKKDAVRRRWEAAQRVRDTQGVQGGNAADTVQQSMLAARRRLDAKGEHRSSNATASSHHHSSLGGGFDFDGADRTDSFSPRAGDLDMQRVGSWRKGYSDKKRAAPLEGTGLLSPGADPHAYASPDGAPPGRAGLGRHTHGAAPALGQGGGWVDAGAGMELHGSQSSHRGSGRKMNAEQAAAAAAQAAGAGSRGDSKLAAKLQRQYEASQKKLTAAKKRSKRATKARGFKFHSSASRTHTQQKKTKEHGSTRPQASMHSSVERDVFPGQHADYASDGSAVDSAGALSDWERRFVIAQARRIALLAARRCKKNKRALKQFRTLPSSPASDSEEGDTRNTRQTTAAPRAPVTSKWSKGAVGRRSAALAKAAAARRLSRKNTATRLLGGAGGLHMHQWWAKLTALAELHQEQKRRNVFQIGNMQLQGDKAMAARHLAAKTASSAISAMLMGEGRRKGAKGRAAKRHRTAAGEVLGISPEGLRACVAEHVKRRSIVQNRVPQAEHLGAPHIRAALVEGGGGHADVLDGLSSSEGGGSSSDGDPQRSRDSSARELSQASSSLLHAARLYSDGDVNDDTLGVDVWGSGYGADWMAHMAQEDSGSGSGGDSEDAQAHGRMNSEGPSTHLKPPPVLTLAQLEARQRLADKRAAARTRKGRTLKGAAMAVSFMGRTGGSGGGAFDEDALAKARAAAHRFGVSRGLVALTRDGPLAVAGVVQSRTRQAAWLAALRREMLPVGAYGATRRALGAALRGCCAVSVDDSVVPHLKQRFLGHVGRDATGVGEGTPNAPRKPAAMVLGAPVGTRAARRRTPEWAEHVLEHGGGLFLPLPWVLHHTDLANEARRCATGDPSLHTPPSALVPYAHGQTVGTPIRRTIHLSGGTRSSGCSWSDTELDAAVAVRRRAADAHRDLQRYAADDHGTHFRLKQTLTRRTVYAGVTPRVLRSWAHRWLTHYASLCRKVTSVWLTPRVGGFLARLDALLGMTAGEEGGARGASAKGVRGDTAGSAAGGLEAARTVLGSSVWGHSRAEGHLWGGTLGASASAKLVHDLQRHSGAGSLTALRARQGSGRRVIAKPRLVEFGGGLVDVRRGMAQHAHFRDARFLSGGSQRNRQGEAPGLSLLLPGGGFGTGHSGVLLASVPHVAPIMSMRSRAVVSTAGAAGRLARTHQLAVLAQSSGQGASIPRDIAGTMFMGGAAAVPTANLPTGPRTGAQPDAPHEAPYGGGVLVEQLADQGSSSRPLTSDSVRPKSHLARTQDAQQGGGGRSSSILAVSPWRSDPDVSVAQRREALQTYVGQWGALIAVHARTEGAQRAHKSSIQRSAYIDAAPLRGLQAYYAENRAGGAVPLPPGASSRQASTGLAAAEQLQEHLTMYSRMLHQTAAAANSEVSPPKRILGGGFTDTSRRGGTGAHLTLGSATSSLHVLQTAMQRYPSLYATLLGRVSEAQAQLALQHAPQAVRSAVLDSQVAAELSGGGDSGLLQPALAAAHSSAAVQVPGWHAGGTSSRSAASVSAWDAALAREPTTFTGGRERPPLLVVAPSVTIVEPVLGKDVFPEEIAAAAAAVQNMQLSQELLSAEDEAHAPDVPRVSLGRKRVPLHMRPVVLQSASAAELRRHGRGPAAAHSAHTRAAMSAAAHGRSLDDIRVPAFQPATDLLDSEGQHSPHREPKCGSPSTGVPQAPDPQDSDDDITVSLGSRSQSTRLPVPPGGVHKRLNSAQGVTRRPRGAARGASPEPIMVSIHSLSHSMSALHPAPPEGGIPVGAAHEAVVPSDTGRTWRSSGDSIRRMQADDVRKMVAPRQHSVGEHSAPTVSHPIGGLDSDAASVLGGRSVDSEGEAVSQDPIVGGLQLLRQPLARAVPAAMPRLALPVRGLGGSASARSLRGADKSGTEARGFDQAGATETARPVAPVDRPSAGLQGVSRWRKYSRMAAEAPTAQPDGAATPSMADPSSVALSGSSSRSQQPVHAHRALLDSAMAARAARTAGLNKVRSASVLTSGQLGAFQLRYAKAEYKQRKRRTTKRRRRRRRKARGGDGASQGTADAPDAEGGGGGGSAGGSGSDWESDGSDVEAIMARVLRGRDAVTEGAPASPVGILKQPGAAGLFSASASAVAFRHE